MLALEAPVLDATALALQRLRKARSAVVVGENVRIAVNAQRAVRPVHRVMPTAGRELDDSLTNPQGSSRTR
jgi:hypothetical protein